MGRRFGKGKKAARQEPSYVRTDPYDGRKSVDLDEFIKDRQIREQVKRLAKESEGR